MSHFIQYQNYHFRKHHQLRYFIINMKHHCAQNSIIIFMKKNLEDMAIYINNLHELIENLPKFYQVDC